MTMVIDGTNGVQFPDNSIQTGAIGRNRIINGAMVIDQRAAGASSTAGNGTYTTCDRWQTFSVASSKYTVQQNAGSVTPPTGFTNYLGATSSAATSLSATDYYFISQRIEGFNTADLAWGTANAQTVTLSFWVRSSLTGTFGGSINSNGYTRAYPFTYTISSANTWTQVSVTIPGDTSGTWLTSNNIGLIVIFNLGCGSSASGTAGAWNGTGSIFSATGATSVVGTNGATFYITGVQLEKGSAASPFEYRSYGQELALCQRYHENSFNFGVAEANGTGNSIQGGCWTGFGSTNGRSPAFTYKVQKRSSPTITYYNDTNTTSTAGKWGRYNASWADVTVATGIANTHGFYSEGTGTFTANVSNLISGFWSADCEL